MDDPRKTTWTSAEGTVTFILPDRTQHSTRAQDIDRPNTLCEFMDTYTSLSTLERRALLRMATAFELSQTNPKTR